MGRPDHPRLPLRLPSAGGRQGQGGSSRRRNVPCGKPIRTQRKSGRSARSRRKRTPSTKRERRTRDASAAGGTAPARKNDRRRTSDTRSSGRPTRERSGLAPSERAPRRSTRKSRRRRRQAPRSRCQSSRRRRNLGRRRQRVDPGREHHVRSRERSIACRGSRIRRVYVQGRSGIQGNRSDAGTRQGVSEYPCEAGRSSMAH
jgi:hypothetical protein